MRTYDSDVDAVFGHLQNGGPDVTFLVTFRDSSDRFDSVQTAHESGCWENGFSADFLEYLYFIPEMKPISNIAY